MIATDDVEVGVDGSLSQHKVAQGRGAYSRAQKHSTGSMTFRMQGRAVPHVEELEARRSGRVRHPLRHVQCHHTAAAYQRVQALQDPRDLHVHVLQQGLVSLFLFWPFFNLLAAKSVYNLCLCTNRTYDLSYNNIVSVDDKVGYIFVWRGLFVLVFVIYIILNIKTGVLDAILQLVSYAPRDHWVSSRVRATCVQQASWRIDSACFRIVLIVAPIASFYFFFLFIHVLIVFSLSIYST